MSEPASLIQMPRPETEPARLREIRKAAGTRRRQKQAERFLKILFDLEERKPQNA